MDCIVLYNKNNEGCAELRQLIGLKPELRASYLDWASVRDFKALWRQTDRKIPLIFCGSDQELSWLINCPGFLGFKNHLYFFPSAERSDLILRLDPKGRPQALRIDWLLEHLPVVSVKGRDYRFLNGISLGIDWKIRETENFPAELPQYCPGQKAKISSAAPVGALVTVDGISRSYKRLWLGAALSGPYLCGGMELLPENKQEQQGELSLLLLHSCGYLGSRLLGRELLSGKQARHPHYCSLLRGHDLSLRFKSPQELIIDGRGIGPAESLRLRSGDMMKRATPVYQCL